MQKTLEDMGTGEKFLNRKAVACAVRSSVNKWDLIKFQSFCRALHNVNKTKRPPIDWERIFTNPKADRGLISVRILWWSQLLRQKCQKAAHEK